MLIPPHTNCLNCGSCCGLVPISHNEELLIRDYAKNFSEETILLLQAGYAPGMCQFRDNYNKRCSIYPVRPLLCRVFGVIEPLNGNMVCNFGNSHCIKGHLLIDIREERYIMPQIIEPATWKRSVTKEFMSRRERRKIKKEAQ